MLGHSFNNAWDVRFVSQIDHVIILVLQLGMFHISSKLMNGVSIMNGLFYCVSRVEHGVLRLFHNFTMESF
jgi:hypothetical protein